MNVDKRNSFRNTRRYVDIFFGREEIIVIYETEVKIAKQKID